MVNIALSGVLKLPTGNGLRPDLRVPIPDCIFGFIFGVH